jgi:Fe2+ transport system protein B
MYEKKGGGWREGIADDEQVYNSLKELHSERKQVEEIKESVRAILKKKVQTESKLNEDISDIVMSGLQMIGVIGAGFFLRFLIRYMIGEFLKSTKDTTMNGIKSIIQGVKNAWSSLKNMSRINQLEKELESDADIKHAVSHPRTVDFAKVLKQKLDKKDYDLISKITRNNFR